jgi:hypothetical protein
MVSARFVASMLMALGIERRVVITSMIFERKDALSATFRKPWPGRSYPANRSIMCSEPSVVMLASETQA